MRIERSARVLSLVAAMTVSACGSVLQSSDAGTDSGGNDGGPGACHSLDEAACRARADCVVGMCAGICGNDPLFLGCYDRVNGTAPPCPAFAAVLCPAPCSAQTDEASCNARPDCHSNYCPNCSGGQTFAGCSSASDPVPASQCPALAIACPAPCSVNTTQASCDARSDCHSVFVDPGTCGCASVGCCAHFSTCADGKAACTPPSTGVTCKIAIPYCEGPAYVLSYTTNCYEGCVAAAACGIN